MTKARLARIDQVLAKRQPDLTVILDGVHKPHNIAAILRSCDAVGVQEIHMSRPRCGFGQHHMTSGGTQKWMSLFHHQTVAEAVSSIQQRGFRVLAASLSPRAIDYTRVDLTGPVALLMGAELFGIDRQVLERVDGEIYIPMVGMVESLNVSVACAILLAEARRQRSEKGYYDKPRLAPAEVERLRFEWMHPRLARYYRDRAEDYPPLDSEGDVLSSREK